MEMTNLNVRVDKDVKERRNHCFLNSGINMSTAVNIFFKNCYQD